jgi:hypothetical protein
MMKRMQQGQNICRARASLPSMLVIDSRHDGTGG